MSTRKYHEIHTCITSDSLEGIVSNISLLGTPDIAVLLMYHGNRLWYQYDKKFAYS